ncbi:hypothetical protein HZH68_005934 [Vespula germanica]|uniref:Uncharacterized protein n=1 Tax=Vespula germanica TaxID=30212 RepID=A0A834NF15_VESGE|nr:hypothetical protein HZH68_005934 [Vespula germanica]
MSEADGVEGGAVCKRGFTHHHFAEKPETPEAERHLERRTFDHAGHANFRVESPSARGSPDAATSKRWDLVDIGYSFTQNDKDYASNEIPVTRHS